VDEELWRNPARAATSCRCPSRRQRPPHAQLQGHVKGADGKVAGLIGTIIDITERKRAEQRQAIEYRVSRILSNPARSPPPCRGPRGIFESLGWACGAALENDRKSARSAVRRPGASTDPEVATFLAASRQSNYQPGMRGYPRCSDGQPVWIVDVGADDSFLRGAQAAKAACARRSRCRSPRRSDARRDGVFPRDRRLPDEWLLETGVTIGHRSGIHGRVQAEQELRRAKLAFAGLTA